MNKYDLPIREKLGFSANVAIDWLIVFGKTLVPAAKAGASSAAVYVAAFSPDLSVEQRVILPSAVVVGGYLLLGGVLANLDWYYRNDFRGSRQRLQSYKENHENF